MRVVVDASVARAAGRAKPSVGHPAPACVAALKAIAAGGCRVALSAELKPEWLKHAGPYATRWLAHMLATKRCAVISGSWSDTGKFQDAAADLPGNQPDAVAKDAHLVGAAMACDQRVLSLDLTQRGHLCAIRGAVPSLSQLYWVAPVEDGVIAWLGDGAPDRPALALSGRCAAPAP